MPMLVTDSSSTKISTISETIAPLCRKNRRRTICAWERPTVSFCSSVTSSGSGATAVDRACAGGPAMPGVAVIVPP